MPDLLLELFSEEIPARMQARAADNLKRLVTDGLVAAGLTYDGARAFATPRRLALNVVGVPVASPDTSEERKGPRTDAPDKAIQGFLRGAGLASLDEARIATDPKKGDFYVAVIDRPGRPAPEIIAEVLRETIWNFPWPKSMRWGPRAGWGERAFGEGPELRWVRPLRSILCVFGPETEETEIVDFVTTGDLRAGRATRGHRFMAPAPFEVRRFDDYVAKLEAANVILDGARRREMIRTDAGNLAFAQGLEIVPDDALLDEVAGLVEWPVALMGQFDPGFLDIPQEVVRLTIRNNQKCFVLRDQASGALSNRFVLVANIEAEDGGTRIVAGNERVIAARLKDAQFFWEQDRKIPLATHAEKLAHITFHEKLGTQAERVERIVRLARELSAICGADPDQAEQAARLCKADLVTGMVGEFPEVQGVMGRYYALAEGLDAEVADALRDHYRPLGQGDEVPSAPVSIAVALADKLDMLVGFWAIDEKPTGSKDPYALRRAALGVIRIVLENGLRISLSPLLLDINLRWFAEDQRENIREMARLISPLPGRDQFEEDRGLTQRLREEGYAFGIVAIALRYFMVDRLKVQLREEGARHDLVDAVFALPGQDDLLMIVRRVEALGAFLDTEDGASLLTAYRRAANILRIEEKKDGRSYAGHADPARFALDHERVLFDRIAEVTAEADAALSREDFAAAMAALARLRGPVDTFFDEVTVNADDPALRENRLLLLSQIRAAMDQVADFSKIGG